MMKIKEYKRIIVTPILNHQGMRVTLNREEKLNAMDLLMFHELVHCLKILKKNRSLRVVILDAKGQDFCSGIDVSTFKKGPLAVLSLLKKCLPGQANLAQKVSYLWRALPVPVISVISGRCYGAGLQVALGSDYRIVSPNAKLSIMESKWGLIPDMAGTLGLTDVISCDWAKYLAMTGDEMSAEKALEIGLVFKISDSAMDDALVLAERLIKSSPDSVAAIKKLYHRAYQPYARKILALETWYQMKILFGRNRAKKVKMSLNPEADIAFDKRQNW